MTVTFNYDDRIARARDGMATRDLDALLLTTGTNIEYISGVSGMFGGNNSSRPILYVLPLEGDPAIIAHEFLRESVQDSGIADVRIFDRLSHLPVEEFLSVLDDRELRGGRIGAELGEAMTVDVPLVEFLSLREELTDVEFADASELIWDLRTVKSDREVDLIRRACEITMEAYDRTFEEAEEGDTESEIQSAMARFMLELGGSDPWSVVTSGEDYYAQLTGSGGERPIREGEMVWLDSGCSVGGYWSDFSRAAVVGGPTARQVESQRTIHELTRQAAEMMEPGRPVSEIARVCNESIDDLSLPIRSKTSHRAGRVGHGLGKQITEPPSVSEASDVVITSGMVLTIEPAIATDYGTFHVEENVVVTDDGPELLTPDRWQLWTV